MRYDLHLHTCLSPCADDDMTPATVAGLAKLAGAELIAVTDHNSALNLPAAEAACRAYGLRLLPGIEVNTAEEMHLLCYFKTVERALEYGEALYEALPAFPYDPAVWGEQLVMDEEDRVVRRVERLLTGAARWDVYQAKAACEALRSTTRSVSEIAYDNGFRNLSNFNRQFRSKVGCTPQMYRKEFQNS